MSLTGVKQRRPQLSFTLVANRWGPLLRTLEIALPRGLTVTGNAVIGVQPARRGVRYRLTRRGRTVTVRLARPVSRVQVTVGFPGLTASRSLARRAARRHPGSLTLTGTAPASARLKFHFTGTLNFRR
jgi:hypothetical protein